MTLLEMSVRYEESETALRRRLAELREAARQPEDGEACRALQRRIAALMPLLQERRDLRDLTAHYYDRSYHKHEKYTL